MKILRKRDENSVGNFKRDYLTSIIRDLESRVYDLNEEVKSFVLITDMTAEKSMEEIKKHSKILCSKFSHWNLDEADLIDEVLDMKEIIKNEELQSDLVDVQELSKFLDLNYDRDEMKNLRKLCRLLLIFPFSTVLCESCFSHMNQIKNAYRNRMTTENLENLMFLTLNKGREINYQRYCH